ncbi:MAG: class I SAM-dependent methyltransferase [Candidatus Micrarchaeia archaeon]
MFKKRKNLYQKKDEKFGLIMSFLYSLLTNTGSYKKFSKFVAKDIIENNPTATKILDIGTGPGTIPIEINKILKNKKNNKVQLYGIDPSIQMVNIANRKSKGMENTVFSLGSSTNVPFKMHFDVIFTSLSFHHWAKKEESIVYLKKLLNKSGKLIIYEYNKDLPGLGKKFVGSHSISKDQLVSIAKQCNMKLTVKTYGDFIIGTLTISSN